jgi:hypothetical protein
VTQTLGGHLGLGDSAQEIRVDLVLGEERGRDRLAIRQRTPQSFPSKSSPINAASRPALAQPSGWPWVSAPTRAARSKAATRWCALSQPMGATRITAPHPLEALMGRSGVP